MHRAHGRDLTGAGTCPRRRRAAWGAAAPAALRDFPAVHKHAVDRRHVDRRERVAAANGCPPVARVPWWRRIRRIVPAVQLASSLLAVPKRSARSTMGARARVGRTGLVALGVGEAEHAQRQAARRSRSHRTRRLRSAARRREIVKDDRRREHQLGALLVGRARRPAPGKADGCSARAVATAVLGVGSSTERSAPPARRAARASRRTRVRSALAALAPPRRRTRSRRAPAACTAPSPATASQRIESVPRSGQRSRTIRPRVPRRRRRSSSTSIPVERDRDQAARRPAPLPA